MIGYLCSWFQNAYSFAYAGTTNLPAFTLAEKQQAVLDTTAQLKAFHQNGFIVGDVRGANHLIDKTGGHLIDFEDSFVVGDEKICNAPFYFYHEENKTLAINLATQEEDCRKQNLIHIGFLLGVELEYPMYALRENALLLSDAFGVDKALQAIAQEIFFGEHPPYFDAYLPFFQDEEKNQYEGKKIHKKIQKELIKWYQ